MRTSSWAEDPIDRRAQREDFNLSRQRSPIECWQQSLISCSGYAHRYLIRVASTSRGSVEFTHLAISRRHFYIDINVFFGPFGPGHARRSPGVRGCLRIVACLSSIEAPRRLCSPFRDHCPRASYAGTDGRTLCRGMGTLRLARTFRGHSGLHYSPSTHVGGPGPTRREGDGTL
jgi:hypothetical protein